MFFSPSAKRRRKYFIFMSWHMLVLPTITILTDITVQSKSSYLKFSKFETKKLLYILRLLSLNLSWKSDIHTCLNFVKCHYQTAIIQNIQTFYYRFCCPDFRVILVIVLYLRCKKSDVHQHGLHFNFNFSCKLTHLNGYASEHIKALRTMSRSQIMYKMNMDKKAANIRSRCTRIKK